MSCSLIPERFVLDFINWIAAWKKLWPDWVSADISHVTNPLFFRTRLSITFNLILGIFRRKYIRSSLASSERDHEEEKERRGYLVRYAPTWWCKNEWCRNEFLHLIPDDETWDWFLLSVGSLVSWYSMPLSQKMRPHGSVVVPGINQSEFEAD